MNVSREDKKVEAIKRMRAMKIFPDAIKQFAEDDVVMVSEPPIGGLYWLNDEQKKMVQDFYLLFIHSYLFLLNIPF